MLLAEVVLPIVSSLGLNFRDDQVHGSGLGTARSQGLGLRVSHIGVIWKYPAQTRDLISLSQKA